MDYTEFEEADLKKIVFDEEKYNNTAMFRMFTSKIVNDTVKICSKNLKFIKKEKLDFLWQIYIFQYTKTSI